ncbi:hypothetical protein TrispH2_002986 [Trichoplax sp. H2]|nr:hypothetical protein TrispH2_002986 [Trichoplax sp. H2]|eukprot:RDD45077.1 hypothetical protein TrispH2_002986 [Trichoplax sp. H2]
MYLNKIGKSLPLAESHCNNIAILPSVTFVKSTTKCNKFKIDWNPPAIDADCLKFIRYQIYYKIYSSSGDSDLKFACQDTSQLECTIQLDGRLIGVTIIYKVMAKMTNQAFNHRLNSSSPYYRSWPSMTFIPIPPQNCQTIIDLNQKSVTLTCSKHNRCYYGSSYSYYFYLGRRDSNTQIQKFSLNGKRIKVIQFSQLNAKVNYYWYASSKTYSNRESNFTPQFNFSLHSSMATTEVPTTVATKDVPRSHCNNLEAAKNLKVKIDCTRITFTWDPPAVDSSCQPFLQYGIYYRIYSASGNTDWKYACNKTSHTQCQITLDGRKIGSTLVYQVLASTIDNRHHSTSAFYRTWPNMLYEPAPPKECRSLIDYKKETVKLTCYQHDRCYYGASYHYHFFLSEGNKSGRTFHFIRDVRNLFLKFDELQLDTTYHWLASAMKYDNKVSDNSTLQQFKIDSLHTSQAKPTTLPTPQTTIPSQTYFTTGKQKIDCSQLKNAPAATNIRVKSNCTHVQLFWRPPSLAYQCLSSIQYQIKYISTDQENSFKVKYDCQSNSNRDCLMTVDNKHAVRSVTIDIMNVG